MQLYMFGGESFLPATEDENTQFLCELNEVRRIRIGVPKLKNLAMESLISKLQNFTESRDFTYSDPIKLLRFFNTEFGMKLSNYSDSFCLSPILNLHFNFKFSPNINF